MAAVVAGKAGAAAAVAAIGIADTKRLSRFPYPSSIVRPKSLRRVLLVSGSFRSTTASCVFPSPLLAL